MQSSFGVSPFDEETIFATMEMLCSRVRNMLDIINALAQFSKLCNAVSDLPRLSHKDTKQEEGVVEDNEDDDDYEHSDSLRTTSDLSIDEGMSRVVIINGGEVMFMFTRTGGVGGEA